VNTGRFSFLASALFHAIVIALMFSLSSYGFRPIKTVAIDFTVLKTENPGARGEDRRARIEERGLGDKNLRSKSYLEPRISNPEPDIIRPQFPAAVAVPQPSPGPDVSPALSLSSRPSALLSDPSAEVAVRGETGGAGGVIGSGQRGKTAGEGIGAYSSVGSGSDKVLNYARGGRDEQSFSYIRDGILKNVTYPDRARRMGWEGRVLLSFTVLENGSIHDIKVVNSSGFRALDDSAVEAVRKTMFSRKAPYRLAIVLPVEYKLE
jgi:periplasmic protein TonB